MFFQYSKLLFYIWDTGWLKFVWRAKVLLCFFQLGLKIVLMFLKSLDYTHVESSDHLLLSLNSFSRNSQIGINIQGWIAITNWFNCPVSTSEFHCLVQRPRFGFQNHTKWWKWIKRWLCMIQRTYKLHLYKRSTE